MHRLAWSLDACLKDRVLDDKRMRELHQFFVPLDRPPALGKGPCECSVTSCLWANVSCTVRQPA